MKRLTLAVIIAALFVPACARPQAAASAAAAPRLEDFVEPDLSRADAEAQLRGIESLGDRRFLDEALLLVARRDPEAAENYGLSSLIDGPPDKLGDVSDAHVLGTRELYLALAAAAERRLAASGSGAKAESGRITLEAFRIWAVNKARRIEVSLDDFPVTPLVNSVDWLLTNYFAEILDPRDEAEARRFVRLLRDVPNKMEGICDAIELRAKKGVAPPERILDMTMPQVRDCASLPAERNPYYRSFADRLGAAVPASAREGLLAEAARAVEECVVPAFRELATALEASRAAAPDQGREASGASRLPGGRGYYEACLATQTTTSLSPEEIHETGMRELERIHAAMRALFAAQGYDAKLGIDALFARLDATGRRVYGSELVDLANGLIRGVESRLGEIVTRAPRLAVEAVPGQTGAYYQQPAPDGSRPGRYFVAAAGASSAAAVATTLYHETLPGHHLQIALAMESDIPIFIKLGDFIAAVEGWALYAERLASEMGMYEGNPKGELYRLQMEALRAARLAADTGINAFGWDYSRAVDFVASSTGLGRGFAEYEVVRYIGMPVQATTYYLGYLAILGLREKARAELGGRFDARRFHDAVLGAGALPLGLLEAEVGRFVEAEKARY